MLSGIPKDEQEASFALCGVLGEELFAVAWAEGRAMTMEQAIRYALEKADW